MSKHFSILGLFSKLITVTTGVAIFSAAAALTGCASHFAEFRSQLRNGGAPMIPVRLVSSFAAFLGVSLIGGCSASSSSNAGGQPEWLVGTWTAYESGSATTESLVLNANGVFAGLSDTANGDWSANDSNITFNGTSALLFVAAGCELIEFDGVTWSGTPNGTCPMPAAPLTSDESCLVGTFKNISSATDTLNAVFSFDQLREFDGFTQDTSGTTDGLLGTWQIANSQLQILAPDGEPLSTVSIGFDPVNGRMQLGDQWFSNDFKEPGCTQNGD
jgi:hypothetical protein